MKKLGDLLNYIESVKDNLESTWNYEFHLLGTDYRIKNINSNFLKKVETEYSYFMQPLQHQHRIDIELIEYDTSDFLNLFEGSDIFTIHSTSSKNISYLTDGKKFDRDSQFRKGAKLYYNNHIFIRSFLTDNIITYAEGSSKIYIIGLKNHFSECKDIIENIGICHLESNRYIMLHASCCSINSQGILIIGDSGHGKTTLMMHLIFYGCANFVSNDRVFVKIGDHTIQALGAPLQLAIGLGTFKDFTSAQKFLQQPMIQLLKNNNSTMNTYKIRFQPSEFELLFSGKINLQTNIKTILLPQIQLDKKTSFKKINLNQVLDIIGNNILSPYDPYHPKWLGLISGDEIKSISAINAFKQFVQKEDINVVEVVIGYDIKERVKNMTEVCL